MKCLTGASVSSLLLCVAVTGLPRIPGAAAAAADNPPPTPEHDVVDTYHGQQVHDPYRWLEQADSPAVQKWIDAQNRYADAVMGSFADHGAIARRAAQLALTSTRRASPQIAAHTLFYLRQTPPQPQSVLVAQGWPTGAAKVVVDTNATHGDTAITGYWPSPDGTQVAYGTAVGGTEDTTLHFITIADGKVAADALPYAGGGTTPQAVAWDADGKGVTYVRLPLPGSVPASRAQFDAQLYHHTLGTRARDDTAALGKPPAPIAEYTLVSSARADRSAAFIYYGDANFENVYLRSGPTWHKVLGAEDQVRVTPSRTGGAAWEGDRLLLLSWREAPLGQLLALDADGHSRVLVPQQKWAIDGVTAIKGGFLLVEVSGPDWRICQFKSDGTAVRTVPLPATGIGIDAIAGSEDASTALIAYSGWSVPARWVSFDATSGALRRVFEVKPAADYSKLRTWRLEAPSTGGVRVPVTVIGLGEPRRDDHRPTILSAYGGFALSQAPTFIGARLAWLERGGVYAVANIRGGGEYGEGWHRDGSRANKQHDFDDLHAATQALVAAHWTDAAHLGILGGSNGGLLMGAALTQHPADYRAVVSVVGLYDMLRAQLWPNGAYNTYEFGTVKDATEFSWLQGYSPLQYVRPGTAYSAVLLITGENDPRVAPWQSRKFAAALQNANTSAHPILLITRRNEGHGVTSSFSQRLSNTGAELSFFAGELGLQTAAGSPPN